MSKQLTQKHQYLLWAMLTPIYFWLSHYLALFPHEYAHSLVASISGFKDHFWQIHYGGTSFWNIVFFINVDEKVNYAAMHAANKDWLIALTAFAGAGIANVLTYLYSLWLMTRQSVRSKAWLYYFIFWWNINSIGNFIDYVPSRTFATHGDMAHLAYGLHISPWWIMTILGYMVVGVVWYFYRNTLPRAYDKMNLTHKSAQAVLLIVATYVLFNLYGTVGRYGYGELSNFISLLSIWLTLPIIVFCWPWRRWVKDRSKRQQLMQMHYDHIVLNVNKMDDMLYFYGSIMLLPIERLDECKNGDAPFPVVRLSDSNIIDLFPKDMWCDEGSDSTRLPHNVNHFCLSLANDEWKKLMARLRGAEVKIEEGPVQRGGAKGAGTSIYFKDPDGNLIEARYYGAVGLAYSKWRA